MAQLTRFDNNGIELVIDDRGEVFYPGWRALARVCSIGLDKQIQAVQVQRAIENALSGTVTDLIVLEAEVITPQGLRTVTLIPRKLGTKAIKKHNPDLFEEMAEAGHLVFLHQLAGYKISSTIEQTESPQLPQTYLEALKTLVESEEEKERLRIQNELQASQIDDLEEDVDKYSKLADESFTHSSIVRIAKLNHISETNFKWRVLKAATKMAKMEVKRVPCPRFGEKLLYPHQAWAIAYPDVELPENPQNGLTLAD